MCRSLLRDAVAGKAPPDPVRAKAEAGGGQTLPRYASDSRLRIRRRTSREADSDVIRKAAHQVFAIMKECDELPLEQRRAHVLRRLDEIEASL
jgi:hypothetical protein